MLTGVEQSPEQIEMAGIHHQMEMQAQQLEIAKLEAEIQKLQSEAAVNVAKVQDVADVDPQLRLAELQGKLHMKEQELQLRRELAALTNQTRQSQQQTQAASRIAATAMQTAAKARPLPTE
jgi:hypothetical protein